MPKNSLFPIEYDEISLVDNGASQEADVLIMKRDSSIAKATALYGQRKQTISRTTTRKRKRPVTQTTKKTSPKISTTNSAKKKKTRSLKDPCATGTNSTGAKETDPKKKSQRAKNWKEDKHPRKKDGTMKQTSAESKKKNGKGGTTKAKLDAACRVKKDSGLDKFRMEAIVRSKLERKAAL